MTPKSKSPKIAASFSKYIHGANTVKQGALIHMVYITFRQNFHNNLIVIYLVSCHISTM